MSTTFAPESPASALRRYWLEQLAARYRRTLPGQAAWLIEEAHQRLQQEQSAQCP